MTPMYFFSSILFFIQLYYGNALTSHYPPGKYRLMNNEMTRTCNYDYLMSSATYIDMTGIDHRFAYIENTSEFVPYFAKLIHKQNILRVLQNENESLVNNQLLVEEYNNNESDSDYGINIFAGGLMVDWEANIM
jgi:hypothetical protein